MNIEGQSEPDTFKQHGRWHSHVQWVLDNVFLAVVVVRGAREVNPALDQLSVREGYFEVEGLFVQKFDLKN